MAKTSWRSTSGMPLRTRALCWAASRAPGRSIADMDAADIAKNRHLTPPPKFPVTLVTGRVFQDVVRSEVQIPVRDGSMISARVLRPARLGASAAVVIYYHGGGWTLGAPVDYESLLTRIVHELDVVVVAPDYRKAPEHKAPMAVHDCIDVFDWVSAQPGQLPVQVSQLAVAGDSAGGNLAALVALHARDRGMPLAGQVLIYPAVDLSITHSYRDAPLLAGDALDAYKEHYLGGVALDAADAQISPMNAASHVGLAPALVQTAQFDPLQPEGQAYARKLESAGVPTRFTNYRRVPHGFLNIPGLAPGAAQARDEIVDQLALWLS